VGQGCFPPGEELSIVAQHTTAFLDKQLGNDRRNEDVLKPSRQDLAGRITLLASVVGTGTGSEWADLTLTDPSGRRIGVDPQTGQLFSDFTTQEIQYVTAGQSSTGFSIHSDAVLAGNYILSGHGNASITQPRSLLVTLELMDQQQHSSGFERDILFSGLVNAGMAIDSLQFEIVPAGVPQPGDFNEDGTVDAGDYVVWRKGLGTTYTQADYDVWRAHFGTAGGGVSPSQTSAEPLPAVPEPTTSLLFGSMLSAWIAVRLCRRAPYGRAK
jgi:hypothetical protein